MKITMLKKPSMVLLESKAKAQIGLVLDSISLENLPKLKELGVSGCISLAQPSLDADLVDNLFDEDFPVMSEKGEHEVKDFFVRIIHYRMLTYAMITIDHGNILWVIAHSPITENNLELPNAEILIGEPGVIANVQAAVDPNYIVLTGENGLEEYKHKSGMAEIAESKKVIVALKPGQDLSTQSLEVYRLTV